MIIRPFNYARQIIKRSQERCKMKLAFDVVSPPGDTAVNLPPVIMLHGMMDSRKTWKSMTSKMAAITGRKVYSIDARNHGDSPWSDVFNFDILAEDLEKFLLSHGILKATIVGHSMGGRTALTLALRKPELVEKLVVEDMNTRNFKEAANVLIMLNMLKEVINVIPPGADDLTARRTIIETMKQILLQVSSVKSHGAKSISKNENYDISMLPLKRQGSSYAWQANLDVIEEVLNDPDKLKQNLSGVYLGDALFLYGKKSFFKVDQDKNIPSLFPRAVLLGVEGAGHLIHLERPEVFLQEVTKFIGGSKTLSSKY